MAAVRTCTVTVNKGQPLECRQGMTLFAALKTHGIHMPTGCGARGLCGQCKVRVPPGHTGLFTDSEVRLLTEEERAAGTRLACQLRLDGDLEADIPEYVFAAKPFRAVLASAAPLTHDIRRFSFVPADGGEIPPHTAGQFLTLSVKIPETKVQAIRCFSFATPSSVRDRIDLIIRLNPNGVMTRHLFEQARPGDEVTITAPYGEFHLRDSEAPCVWIAGGSGLSPFLGMVQDMVDKGITGRPVQLFFGAVRPADLYYTDILLDLAARHSWFSFIPALSGEERTELCRDYGLITDVVARHIDDASAMEGYLCGSPGMIAACLKVLAEKGLPRSSIYYDRF